MIFTYENDKIDICRNVVYIVSNGWWVYLLLLIWEVVSIIIFLYVYILFVLWIINLGFYYGNVYIICVFLYVYIFKYCIIDKLIV